MDGYSANYVEIALLLAVLSIANFFLYYLFSFLGILLAAYFTRLHFSELKKVDKIAS